MPTNKNAMTRYKILDELLSNQYHDYSLNDLTEEVNRRLEECGQSVSRRMIEKDIHYLEYEGPFQVLIKRYSKPAYDYDKKKTVTKQCLRYENPKFSIFSKTLTDDEEYLIGEALSLLGQFDGLPNLDALEGLRCGWGVNRNDRHIIAFTKNPLEGTRVFGELFTAISQKQVIEIHYRLFGHEEERQVNLHPYLLREYNRRWYVLGATEEDDAMLTFALERILNIVPLPSHKYQDYEGDINEWYEDIVGVTNLKDSPVYEIYFWVSDISKDYVKTKPIHESQRTLNETKTAEMREKYPSLKGGQFFRIDCKYNYELIRELTSFGKELIVLEPEYIYNKVKERINGMIEEYGKLRTYRS